MDNQEIASEQKLNVTALLRNRMFVTSVRVSSSQLILAAKIAKREMIRQGQIRTNINDVEFVKMLFPDIYEDLANGLKDFKY